jgi:hypothetical protein
VTDKIAKKIINVIMSENFTHDGAIDKKNRKGYLHVTDVFEGGPELGGIVAMLVDRLLVKLINDPFDIPRECLLNS